MAINFGLRSKKHREAHAQLRTLKKFFLTQRTFFLKAIDDDTRLYDAFDATRKHYKENPRLVRAYNKTVRDIIKIQYALVTAALASQKRLMGIYDKISRQLVADLEVAFFLFVASTEGGIKNCILNLTFLEDKAAARTLKQTLGGILQEKNSIYKMMRRL
jgi:formiminotetrahydrofolate cyclodeaminase